MSEIGVGYALHKFFEAAKQQPPFQPSAPLSASAKAPSSKPTPTVTAPLPTKLFDIVKPDPEMAAKFFRALFGEPRGQLIHFRAVPEPARLDTLGNKEAPKNLHYLHDANFPTTIAQFLDWCMVDQRAAFFLPGLVSPGGTGKADVQALPAIVVDFDKGNPNENLAAVESLIGPASIVVESGGRTESGPKLHAYWRFDALVVGRDIDVACRVREELAVRFGGDPAFKQAAQVIRVPGSVHLKGTPAPVRLRHILDARYSLAHFVNALGIATQAQIDNYFDFSGDRPVPSLDRALTQPVHEGAVDEITRFDAAGQALGHFIRMVREGRYSLDEAWKASKDWNRATLVPPWDEARLRNDFERLVRIDKETHGPVVPPPPAIAFVPESTTWNASAIPFARERYFAEPPERRFVVDGMIPEGTAGVFGAVGDAGKSLMVLNLLNIVSSHSAPQSDPLGPAGMNDTPCFFGRPIIKRGPAIYLTTEDTHDEISRRLRGLDPSGTWRKDSAKLITLRPEDLGTNEPLIREGKSEPACTIAFARLRELILFHKPAIVAVDPLSTLVLGNLNDNALGAFTMKMFGALAEETGAAILAVHHFAKSTTPTNLSDARHAIRGAGALVDNGRWALALWEADEDQTYATLKALGRSPSLPLPAGMVYFGGLAKGNAPGEKTLRTLARDPANGLLRDVTDALRAAAPKQDETDDAVYRALRAHAVENPRLSFGQSEKSLSNMWGPVLRAAGIKLPRAKMEDTFLRLKNRKLMAATGEIKGGHILYAPALDQLGSLTQ